MKRMIYALIAACFLIVGCNKIDSLLDTVNYEKSDTSNFPKTEKDAMQIVTSIYSGRANFYYKPKEHNIWRDMLASDECIGGGNGESVGTDHFLEDDASNSEEIWGDIYYTIFRCNYAIESISPMDVEVFSSADAKNYLLGQAYFLRAWTDWELAEMYETFPLLNATAPVNNPRATVEEIYESITNDLLKAIELMPAKYGYAPGNNATTARATKYAAEAALARVWMFYTGFYKKSDMFGVTKSDVIAALKDVRDNSNFSLVSDPRNIWPYTNEYTSGFAFGTDFDTYASRNGLKWEGNLCKESIWVCHFSNIWHRENGYTGYNRIGEYSGINNGGNPNDDCYPWGVGSGGRPVNNNMVKDWLTDPDYGPNDKRLWGTVFATGDIADNLDWMKDQYVEIPRFFVPAGKQAEDTFFHDKKYQLVASYSDASKSKIYKTFFNCMEGDWGNSQKYDNRNDVIYIRYADVLLMLDELEQTVTGMNQLRARAGLAPYDGYTFERLQKERRYELAFEGLRFYDLRRWYPEDAGKIISDNQIGCYIWQKGKEVKGGWVNIPGNTIEDRYKKTRGFWMIAPSQITLSEGVLTQTPGWESGDNFLYSEGMLPYEKSN